MKMSKLLALALVLLISVGTLAGSTIAWFTDSVTSTGNKIESGTLKIDLELKEGDQWISLKDEANKDKAIFENSLWEPGYTELEQLKISNKGTLALEYTLGIIRGTDEVKGANGESLADVIEVYTAVVDDSYTEPESVADVKANFTKQGMLSEFSADGVAAEKNVLAGKLLPAEATEVGAGEVKGGVTMAVALHMQEEAGNEYQGLSLGTVNVALNAKQYTYESDSFDNQYDAGADEAPKDSYTLNLVHKSHSNRIGAGVIETEYELSATPDGSSKYVVTLDVGHFADIQEITINDKPVAVDISAKYDTTTNDTFTFKTGSVGTIKVKHVSYADSVVMENEKVVRGFFSMSEVDFAEKVKLAAGSIAVPYTKNGTQHYAVGEEETMVLVAPEEKDYEVIQANGDKKNIETKKSDGGDFYSIVSGLQENAYSNVFILPGTYNCATTVYVYSSLTVAGLGDTDDIKVIKTSSSKSNRHLFNATGTKSDYIVVTIRNLSLDATATTTGGKDNAAVQSIRKSKVKCVDLNVTKGTGWSDIAFYVNGNNAVDGVKYPAYLYVENAQLNTTRSFGVVSTAGTYKFYHNGLTYGGTDYTQNSGSIKNVIMEDNDWDW